MRRIELRGTNHLPNSSGPRKTNPSRWRRFFSEELESLHGDGATLVSCIEDEVYTMEGSIEAFSRYLPTIALFEFWMLESLIELEDIYKRTSQNPRNPPGTEPIELIKQNPIIQWNMVTEPMMVRKLETFLEICTKKGISLESLKAMKIDQEHVQKYVQMQQGGKEVAGNLACNWPLGCPCNKDRKNLTKLGIQHDHVNLNARGGNNLQPMCGLHNRWKSSNQLFNLLSIHHHIFEFSNP